METPKFIFKCSKCSCTDYEISELRGASGGFSAILNLDTKILTVVSCANCGYSETYKMGSAMFKHRHNIE